MNIELIYNTLRTIEVIKRAFEVVFNWFVPTSVLSVLFSFILSHEWTYRKQAYSRLAITIK